MERNDQIASGRAARSRRRLWTVAALGVALVVCGGCSNRSSRGGGAGGTAAGSATPPAVPADPLTDAMRTQVARTFAPQYRYNAYHNDGNGSRQNRNEDYFPMGVASFFRELESGQVRVAVQESREASPSQSELQPFAGRVAFGPQVLGDYPNRMPGDPIGDAPTYYTVYEDVARRTRAPDGSGEIVVFVEYWLFYAFDRADAKPLYIPLPSSLNIGGHRADWEQATFEVRVTMGPGSTFVSGELLSGAYYAHGEALTVDRGGITTVNDAGVEDPAGTHPLAFVAQGKHATYPEAGELPAPAFPSFLAELTDFFRGNGVWVDAWRTKLVDLEDPAAAPEEWDTPEFRAIMARSSIAPLADWAEFSGRWGPDALVIPVPGFGSFTIGFSPQGPRAKPTYRSFGGRGNNERWDDFKARKSQLVSYRDRGITIPRANPIPLPVRR